jgi:hypothetical protein
VSRQHHFEGRTPFSLILLGCGSAGLGNDMTVDTLIIKLSKPGSLFLHEGEWEIVGDLVIDGISVDENDTPWGAMGDLLVDRADSSLVGISFVIDPPSYSNQVRDIVSRLDRSCIKHVASAHTAQRGIIAKRVSAVDRVDITWARARDPALVVAQLMCGQWFWCYSKAGDWGICPPVVAFEITEVGDILRDFGLRVPSQLTFDASLSVRRC